MECVRLDKYEKVMTNNKQTKQRQKDILPSPCDERGIRKHKINTIEKQTSSTPPSK
jgi:hypothetical protein